MSLIDLYINDSGRIRRIGDNCHDMLTIDEDGRLRYHNLQNGDGCVLGEPRSDDELFYEFVSNVDDFGYNYDPRSEGETMSKYEEWVNGCCGECKHYKKCSIDGLGLNGSRISEWTCCNSDSDYYMDYTGYTDTCEQFGQRGTA